MAGKNAEATIAGLKLVAVNVDELQPNFWNPNEMDEQMFQKELRSIRDHGFIDPITVRMLPDGTWQIIDGEHRWKAAAQLGFKVLPATNLGTIADDRAKKLTILYNDVRGQSEPVKLAKLLKELAENTPVTQLAEELPMSSVEIETLIKSTENFAWRSDEDIIGDVSNEGRVSEDASANEKKFQLGTVRGSLPQWLTDALLKEWQASSGAVRSKTPETIAKDWLARLQASPPAVAAPLPVPAAPSGPPAAKSSSSLPEPPGAPGAPAKRRGTRKAAAEGAT